MRKENIIILLIFIILIFTYVSCQSVDRLNRTDVFSLFEDEFESISLFHYDFDNQMTTEYFEYESVELKQIVNKLNSIKGKSIDTLDIGSGISNAIGLEMNPKGKDYGGREDLFFLIIDNQIIDNKDNIYIISDDDVNTIDTLTREKTQTRLSIDNIVNHRSIAFKNNSWDSRFLMKSDIESNFKNDIEFVSSEKDLLENDYKIKLKVMNNRNTTIEYDEKLCVEAKIDHVWYRIDDLMINNIKMVYPLILHRTQSGETQELFGIDMSLFMPLPVGEYRLLKEFTDGNNTIYAQFNFRITWNGIEYE